MKNLLFFLSFYLFSFSLFSQNTYYSFQDGAWSDSNTWSASATGNGPAGPPSASDHVVIRDSVWHSLSASYIHTGNITVAKYARYQINNSPGEVYIFGGSLFDIFGKVITTGDIANQIPGSPGSGLIVINPWAKLHAGDDIILNAYGSLIIDNPNCGSVQTCDDIYFDGDGSGVCGEGSLLVPGQVRVFDNNGNEITPYPAALAAAANQVCQSFPFYDSKNNCSLQLPLLTGTDNSFPVELISFTANSTSTGVRLTWETASELNNDFFTLERARDEITFEAMAEIAGAGNSDAVISYEYTDKDELNGKVFYRLRQTDFDGKFSYSSIIEIVIDRTPSGLHLFPNPIFSGPFFLQLNDAEHLPVRVEIRDSQGKIILTQMTQTDYKGSMSFPIDIQLPAGYYFVSAITPGKKYTTRLLRR
ncbi:MAG: T9SS type A sorting domain-containing protein [Bacteroidia bacterium]|nr:T9SS type A sorting domain-containing protein [Bacteroidia bacterium]